MNNYSHRHVKYFTVFTADPDFKVCLAANDFYLRKWPPVFVTQPRKVTKSMLPFCTVTAPLIEFGCWWLIVKIVRCCAADLAWSIQNF